MVRASSLRSILAVVLTMAATACSPAAPAPASSEAGRVNDAMTTVAAERVEVEGIVTRMVEAAGRVEPLASELRSPAAVDAALERVPSTLAAFDQLSPAAAAAAVDELELAIGRAAGIVDAAIAVEAEGSWEREFLGAQRSVLDALAGWSATNATVVAELDSRWATWDELVREAAVLDENRWRYRTTEEAAGTWEVENGGRVAGVREASAVLPSAVELLASAAAKVGAADDRAAEVFRARPAS